MNSHERCGLKKQTYSVNGSGGRKPQVSISWAEIKVSALGRSDFMSLPALVAVGVP